MTVENTETTENTDLKPLDRQDVFNRVATHLLTQNKKSAIQRPPEKGGEFCVYRGPDGTKCAIGALIKDEFYSSDLERKYCDHGVVIPALEASLNCCLSDDDKDFLRRLQRVHDSAPVVAWRRCLRKEAKLHGLSADVVDNFPVVAATG